MPLYVVLADGGLSLGSAGCDQGDGLQSSLCAQQELGSGGAAIQSEHTMTGHTTITPQHERYHNTRRIMVKCYDSLSAITALVLLSC